MKSLACVVYIVALVASKTGETFKGCKKHSPKMPTSKHYPRMSMGLYLLPLPNPSMTCFTRFSGITKGVTHTNLDNGTFIVHGSHYRYNCKMSFHINEQGCTMQTTLNDTHTRTCAQRSRQKDSACSGKRQQTTPAAVSSPSTFADANTLTTPTTNTASPQATETQIPDPPLPPSPTAAGDAGG